jgi:phosphoribosylformimino-5-aminoimidazole carboxamide ribotide isomerase
MKIIPAIDIYDGKCVRLFKGDYNLKTEYSNSPVDVAKRFESEGAKFLHLVDLEGAKSNKIINYKVVKDICSKTKLKVDFGGGIKSENDISFAFDLGVNQITVGSLAVKDKEIVIKSLLKYGTEKIILGADFLDNTIKINGWITQTGIDLFDFISEFYDLGLRYVIATDISKDGVMKGPSNETYKKILKLFPKLKLIASGGISDENDFQKLIKIGCYGAITGKALYEKTINLKSAIKKYGS